MDCVGSGEVTFILFALLTVCALGFYCLFYATVVEEIGSLQSLFIQMYIIHYI